MIYLKRVVELERLVSILQKELYGMGQRHRADRDNHNNRIKALCDYLDVDAINQGVVAVPREESE